MPTTHFVQERRPGWERLDALIRRCRGGRLTGLSGEQILELGRLYQSAAADLAAARSVLGSGDETTIALNHLVTRAHGVVYSAQAAAPQRLAAFVWNEFPCLLRRLQVYVWIATGVSAAGALFAFWAALWAPELGARIAPADYSLPHGPSSVFALSFIATHNIWVAAKAFAFGATAGLLTVEVLLMNGLMLGKVAAIMLQKHLSLPFWSSILPHGVLELTAIMIAGGAGLRIAWGILAPGDLTRATSMRHAGTEAVQLMVGTVPLFLTAGTIEGLLSFSVLPIPLKLAIAACAVLALTAYLHKE